jgi:hypothetical protein
MYICMKKKVKQFFHEEFNQIKITIIFLLA